MVDARPVPGRARPTSADVAREAGVSRATVSYVLNDTPHQAIPEPTRERVRAAAARLGYAPSAAARALRLGRTAVVLVVLPDWPVGHNLARLVEHLSAALAGQRLTVVTHQRSAGAQPLAEVWRAITPAAVVGVEAFDPADEAAIRAAGIQVAVAMLDGRRRGALALPQQQVGRVQVERLAAGAGAAVDAWLAAAPAVTGVCAYNDEVAFAVLAGARARGVAVPDGLAVVGVDDVPTARFAAPPLTSVEIDTGAIARHLAATVTRALAGQPAPRRPGTGLVRLEPRASG